jgi:hypothetical protein
MPARSSRPLCSGRTRPSTGSLWTEYSTNAVGTVVHAFVDAEAKDKAEAEGEVAVPVPYLLGMDGGLWKGTGTTFVPINVVEP